MVDLETMDNVGTSAIVSIGAVQCNLTTGEIGDTFYRVVDLVGQIEAGRTINPDTLYWWLGQSEGARGALTVPGKLLLAHMLDEFNAWLLALSNNTPGHLRLWGNGASFDNAILRNAYRSYHQDLCIPFWQDRDMRTILGFFPKSMQEAYRKNNMRVGTYHNPKDDCLHQIKYCSHVLQELGVRELY